MNAVTNWIETEWLSILIPVIVFWIILVLTFWLRKLAYDYARSRVSQENWKANERIMQALQRPSALWCLIISIYFRLIDIRSSVGLEVLYQPCHVDSAVDLSGLSFVEHCGELNCILWALLRMTRNAILFSRNIVRAMVLFLAVLIALEIWEVPTHVVYVVLVVAILLAIISFRDAFPNFFAGIQMGATQQIKVGDYIKMEGGEEGYIVKMGWNNTLLTTPEENIRHCPQQPSSATHSDKLRAAVKEGPQTLPVQCLNDFEGTYRDQSQKPGGTGSLPEDCH